MLAGVTEAAALVALFGVNAAMILFGLAMERANRSGEPVDWHPFAYGCVAGAVPWIAIGLQLVVAESEGSDVPGFVFAIFVTLFALFNSFAVNMVLQYRRAGPGATRPSPRPPTSCSASRRSRRSPGRSTPAHLRAAERRRRVQGARPSA